MEDIAALAKLRLEEMLTYFGVNTSAKADFDESTITLSVQSDDTGRLIGRHGETLDALQQLVNALVRAHTAEHVYISVDVGDYKKARAEALSESAKNDAQHVAQTGEPRTLRPMNAAERRIVHMALADIPEVVTESQGDGRERRVVIKPKP